LPRVFSWKAFFCCSVSPLPLLAKSAVSRLVARLEQSYRQWQRHDLSAEAIVYLYLDAIYLKVRSGGRVVSLPVLVALGVRGSGEKILLSLATAGAERTAAWEALLEDLAARRLGRPRLVIADGNPGLAAALERVWPAVARQRCTVHKLRNLEGKAPQHAHAELREDYHRIVYAEDRAAAERARAAFLRKWSKHSPAVAASLEEAGEELLAFYAFPSSQGLALRTTNAIERLQQEFRRRVKTQCALPSETAALRLMFGLFASGQIRLRRIKGFRDIQERQQVAASKKRFFMTSQTKCATHFSTRFGTLPLAIAPYIQSGKRLYVGASRDLTA
jgi:putative transposase